MGIKYSNEQKRLIEAARTGDLGVLKDLLGQKMDLDCELKYGSSALMIAASRGHAEIVEFLISNGAKVNRRNKFGASALIEAVEKGHIECVKKLAEHGADINMPHNHGATPLMTATMHRDVRMMKLLLELGANPEIANFDGWTPVKWAMAESNQKLLEVLGVNTNTTAHPVQSAESTEEEVEHASTPEQLANDAYWIHFMRAASAGDANAVRRLAEEEGVEVNGQSPNGTTALIAAAKNGHAGTVCELIELGADLSLTDHDGLTALAWAARKGQILIVEELEKNAKATKTDSKTSINKQPRAAEKGIDS